MTSAGNIVLCGMPSSGKSTIGKMVADVLGMQFVDTDALIVEQEGKEISDIFRTEGETYFRKVEAEIVERVSKKSGVVISLGGGAVLNAENVSNLKAGGRIYFLERDLDKLTPTQDRPLSGNREKLAELFKVRMPIYRQVADVFVDNNGSPENTVKKIIDDYKR